MLLTYWLTSTSRPRRGGRTHASIHTRMQRAGAGGLKKTTTDAVTVLIFIDFILFFYLLRTWSEVK